MRFLILAILLYPLLYFIDFFNKSDWSMNYYSFMKEWWVEVILIYVCYQVYQFNKDFKYQMLDRMRENEFFSEYNRYGGTPFVAPLLLMYMKSPPTTHRPSDYAYVNDTFYRLIVNVFRDRVYVLADTDALEPSKRVSYLRVIGWANIFKCAAYYLLPVFWIGYVYYILHLNFLNNWTLVTLPIIFLCWLRAAYMMQAFLTYRPSLLDEKLKLHGTDQLRLTWRDVFPDTEIGATFNRVYYVEKEKRARYDFTLKGVKIPPVIDEWYSNNYAPTPFPSDKIPAWENQYQPLMKEKIEEVARKSTNVVSFPRK